MFLGKLLLYLQKMLHKDLTKPRSQGLVSLALYSLREVDIKHILLKQQRISLSLMNITLVGDTNSPS